MTVSADKSQAPPSWTTQEREAAIEQLRATVAGAVAQWRGALGLPTGVAPPPTAGAFAFDLSRIDRNPASRPVFVLGEARSGTTAMLRALRDGAGFFAWPEGHVFSALPPLLTGLRFHLEQYQRKKAHPAGDFALDHLDVYRVLNALAHAFDAHYADAAAAAGAARWADKTTDAGALLAVPLLAQMYPGARFIFMHRHPIKVILSRRKKFPQSAVEAGVHAWASTMQTWLELKKLLDPASIVEVAQADLAMRSDDVIAQLAPSLGLNEAQATAMTAYLRRERPESTGSVGDDAEVYLDDLDWATDLREWFRRMCAAPARAYGYPLDRAEASS